jgi:hypothetical protein
MTKGGVYVKLYMKKPFILFNVFALLFTLAVFIQPSSVKATDTAYTVPSPTDDAWASSSSAFDGTNLKIKGTSTPKEAFLKFDVSGSGGANINGTVNSAKLRLWITTTVSGSTTSVYAADNNWAESTLTWTNRPRQTTLLKAQANPVGVNTSVDFDVTSYISGAGTFSFKLTSDSTGDITFDSSEGTHPPQLVLNYSDSSDRSPSAVIATGETYKDRYSSQTDIDDIGIFDVTKQPYGADPTGVADSTKAIQRAVNEARDARVVAYFPGGTYKVSDTIELVEGLIDYTYDVQMQGVNERWNMRDFSNMLMGPPSGTRAKIVLDSGASGFGNTGAPKVLLHFWSRNNDVGGDPTQNERGVNYNQTISNIDIDLSGKAGAIGISNEAAQGSSVSDLTITATGAYAGISGVTGPGGSITGVTVDGGQYGGLFNNGMTPLITNSTFKNQTVNSILYSGRGSLTLVGVWLEGKGILLSGAGASSPWNGDLTMVDSVVKLATAGTAISGDRSVYINNSYFYQASTISNLNTVTPFSGNGTDWAKVKEYAGGITIDQSPQWDPTPGGDVATVTPNWVNGVKQTTPVAVKGADGFGPPADIQTRHAWTKTPSWQDTGVKNVKTDYGAAGDGVTDDYTAIQNAINAGTKIFLPKGDYLISQPLNLSSDTVLFGVNKNISVIRPKTTGTNSYSNAASPNPLISSPDSASAAPMLADLKLLEQVSAHGAYLLNWRSGEDSIVKDVNFDRRLIQPVDNTNMDFPLIKIQGNGGGKWYNFWNESGSNQGTNYRHIYVNGTTQKLAFYMFNVEHAVSNMMAEFNNVSNVEIYQFKAEGETRNARFTNSDQFRIFGFGGTSSPENTQNIEVVTSNDFLLAGQFYQQMTTSGIDPTTFDRVKETLTGGSVITAPGYNQFVLYKQGNPLNTDPVGGGGGTTLLSDDFQDGNSTGWTTSGGTWAVQTEGTNKLYNQSDTVTGMSSAGQSTWTDYSVEAQIKVDAWSGTGGYAGILGRYQGSNDHYRLRYVSSTNQIKLEKKIGGNVTVLDSVTVTPLTTGTYHTFKLDMNGSLLTGYLDGVQKVSFTDTALSSGQVGLYTFNQAADFDNVQVVTN